MGTRRFILLLSTAVGLFVPVAAVMATDRWRGITPFEQTYRVANPRDAVIETHILDPDGGPLYVLVCRTCLDDSTELIYGCDLDCHLLFDGFEEYEGNLLSDLEGDAAWHSRGRVEAKELCGPCGDYPEYGRVRHFRMRGIQLTLEFQDVVFQEGTCPSAELDPVLESYSLKVTATNEPGAVLEMPEAPEYMRPRHFPEDCRSVARRHE